MTLSHERIQAEDADPGRWLVFLHGIYGAGRNWASVARRVVRARPDWGALVVDLRQHGSSQGLPPPHTVDTAAEDVRALVRESGLAADALLGHSFGGKVALLYAASPPVRLRQLWVVDSTPDARPPAGSAWAMLDLLRGLPERFSERSDGVQALVAAGLAEPIAQWMGTNLVRGPEGDDWRWRIALEDMTALLESFFATDAWGAVDEPSEGLDVHVIRATDSSVLDPEAVTRVEQASRRTGRVHLHNVEGGHWLNADNPGALVELLAQGLPRD